MLVKKYRINVYSLIDKVDVIDVNFVDFSLNFLKLKNEYPEHSRYLEILRRIFFDEQINGISLWYDNGFMYSLSQYFMAELEKEVFNDEQETQK